MKTNKYMIFIARRLWFQFWIKLMDGFAPSDAKGNYKRPTGFMNESHSANNTINKKKFFLLVGLTCPWCHRLIISYKLLHLQDKINLIFLSPKYDTGEWIFAKKFFNNQNLKDVYNQCGRSKTFRETVPTLVNYDDGEMELISNESRDILKILNLINQNSSMKNNPIKNCNEKLLRLINDDINNGVYMCGFARNQNAYKKASKKLFAALNKVEKLFEENGGPWLLGKELSMADVYLFPTIIRWELIYSKLFKCTEKDINLFKNIIRWRYKFYNLKGIPETCSDKAWLRDYYQAIFPLNPNQIIPLHTPLKDMINLQRF